MELKVLFNSHLCIDMHCLCIGMHCLCIGMHYLCIGMHHLCTCALDPCGADKYMHIRQCKSASNLNHGAFWGAKGTKVNTHNVIKLFMQF